MRSHSEAQFEININSSLSQPTIISSPPPAPNGDTVRALGLFVSFGLVSFRKVWVIPVRGVSVLQFVDKLLPRHFNSPIVLEDTQYMPVLNLSLIAFGNSSFLHPHFLVLQGSPLYSVWLLKSICNPHCKVYASLQGGFPLRFHHKQ